jgi:hypothetical protein
MCFLKLLNWDITEDLRSSVINSNYKNFAITTSSSKLNSIKSILKGYLGRQHKLQGFQKIHGIFGQNLASIENYALPKDLEKNILSEIMILFGTDEIPVVRLQRIHGGNSIPIHIDMTRHSSLIIPLEHHDNSITNFFKYNGVDCQLIDPLRCEYWKSIEIDRPTLIDTKVPHNVVLSKNTVRVSITAKWPNTSFNDLKRMISIS